MPLTLLGSGSLGGSSGGSAVTGTANPPNSTQCPTGSTYFVKDGTGKVIAEYIGTGGGPVKIADLSDQLSINTYTANFAFALADAQNLVKVNSATAVVATVTAFASVPFSAGMSSEVLRYGAGTVTFAPDTGVTIRSAGGKLSINDQYGTASVLWIAQNEVLLVGDLS